MPVPFPSSAAAAELLVAAGKGLMDGGVRNVVWRATTAKNNPSAWDERCEIETNFLMPLLRAGGWRTHDTFNATLLLTQPDSGATIGWYVVGVGRPQAADSWIVPRPHA